MTKTKRERRIWEMTFAATVANAPLVDETTGLTAAGKADAAVSALRDLERVKTAQKIDT